MFGKVKAAMSKAYAVYRYLACLVAGLSPEKVLRSGAPKGIAVASLDWIGSHLELVFLRLYLIKTLFLWFPKTSTLLIRSA